MNASDNLQFIRILMALNGIANEELDAALIEGMEALNSHPESCENGQICP